MRKTRTYTEAERKQVIEEAKALGNMAAVARKNDIPVGTLHSWIKPKHKKKAANIGVAAAGANQLSDLKSRLKDSELENKILKELLKKTFQIWNTD